MSKNKRRCASNFSGRHLLINKSLIKELVSLAKLQEGDTVLDLGAGTGALAIPLAEKAGKVIAIENDPVSVEKLKFRAGEKANVIVKQLDLLQYQLLSSPFCIVANIPFSITTPIFEKFLGHSSFLERAVLILEKGAAKRFTSFPVTNPQILAWRMWYDIRITRTVMPECFSPPPSVEAAVVTVNRRNNSAIPNGHRGKFKVFVSHVLHDPQQPFFEAVGAIFTSPQIAKLAKALRMDRVQPICSLNVQQWEELYLAMLQHAAPYRWPKARKEASKSYPRRKR
ncbi:rRNA adenine N(6)-methyltransferase family protein [Paenibacillus antibioticophila]|uniref:rRNA adenine N(6)-methyltransferase family protein n=1 Tax=Paenibacillus antibioticophila TaxID=1274374 RepID=UPI0005CAD586|nr:rRNA adenine N(6)-methyltransferase family protein [Paenibacillus antibioticophila]